MAEKLIVEIKIVYGNEMIYPISEKAKLFAQLIGQKTFTRRDLSLIKLLGYEFDTEKPTL